MNFTDKLAKLLINNRWLSILASVLIVLACALGVTGLGTTNKYEAYLDDDDEQLLAFKRLESRFAKDDNIFIAIHPKSGVVFNPKIIQFIQDFTDKAWTIPHSKRVESLTNYQFSYGEKDDLIVEDMFVDKSSVDLETVMKRGRIALEQKEILNFLLDEKGQTAGINVVMQFSEENLANEVKESVKYLRELIKEYQKSYPDVEIYTTGITLQNMAFSEAFASDTETLFPLMFVVMLFVTFIVYRKVSGLLVIALSTVLSIFAAVGVLGWFKVVLTPDGVAAIAMIMPLAVASCIHILISYRKYLFASHNRISAMKEALAVNITPIFLSNFTTAIGFLSLNMSDSPPYRIMGNTVAVGVVFVFIITIFFVAPILSFFPFKATSGATKNKGGIYSNLTKLVLDNQKLVLVTGMGILIVAILGVFNNELNETNHDFFDETFQYRKDTDWVNDNFAGITNIQFSIESGVPNGITEPEYLDVIDRFTSWLDKQPNVAYVHSISDTVKRLNKNLHGNSEEFYDIPKDKELIAQLLLLYEMSLPQGMDLTNTVTMGKEASRVNVVLHKVSAKEIVEFDKSAQLWLRSNAPAPMWASATGPAVMFAYMVEKNIMSLILGLLAAIVIIGIVIGLFFRSAHIGFISLIPNILPCVFSFGLWGYLDGEVGLALSIVMGMTLGIVVDDTVHLISRYRLQTSNGVKDNKQAVCEALSAVGPALLTSTVVLSAGFIVLAGSHFTQNAELGIMTAITIAIAIVIDFILLPILLVRINSQRDLVAVAQLT